MQKIRNFQEIEGEHFLSDMQEKANSVPIKAEHFFKGCNKSGTYLSGNAIKTEHLTRNAIKEELWSVNAMP